MQGFYIRQGKKSIFPTLLLAQKTELKVYILLDAHVLCAQIYLGFNKNIL